MGQIADFPGDDAFIGVPDAVVSPGDLECLPPERRGNGNDDGEVGEISLIAEVGTDLDADSACVGFYDGRFGLD